MKLGQDEIKLILLTQGKFAIVDVEDYDWLSQYRWCACKSGNTFYAARSKGHILIRMHREIMCAPKGLCCDHKNHNGLDNRKSNLRLCTIAQNTHNQRPRPNGTSKYKGVSLHKNNNKWAARIAFKRKRMHIGIFDNQLDAAIAYDRRAVELFGQFACLNFPERIEIRKWLRKIVWAA